jgi:hypothetical protein
LLISHITKSEHALSPRQVTPAVDVQLDIDPFISSVVRQEPQPADAGPLGHDDVHWLLHADPAAHPQSASRYPWNFA